MKIKVFEAFAGYGSQHIALKRLAKDFPNFSCEVVGISEIDKNPILAYNVLHPGVHNYGDISQIDWHQVSDFDLFTYSFPCFIKGTLIHTERGFIPIEEVTTEDKVLTHTNQYQRVLMVGSRSDAPVIKVRGMCFKDIICTPNHPFYVRKRYKWWNNPIRRWNRKFTNPEWLAAEKLTRDHYIGYAINQKAELPKWSFPATNYKQQGNLVNSMLDKEDFWYLMGRYVGDGWKRINGKYGNSLIICCSDRNRDKLYSSIENLGLHCTSVKERTVEKVFINRNELVAFVERYGYYAHGKKIDEETINLPIPLLKAFIDGYTDADGCFVQNEYKASSVSETLIYGIAHCITKAYKCPVRMYWTKRPSTATIEGRLVNQRDSYSIAWHTEKRKQDKAFYEDGYVWFPVKEVIETGCTDTVYNMEVENDNSYTANGAIVHNCTDISNAGKQEGFTEGSGTRSSLLWECQKAIEVKRPKFLLMENVKALTQKKFMPEFARWQNTLTDFGYTNYWKVLNAKDFGIAQNRERVFMVSIHGEHTPYEFPEGFPLEKCVEDYLLEDVDENYYIDRERITNKVLSDILDQPNVRAEMEKLYHEEWEKHK